MKPAPTAAPQAAPLSPERTAAGVPLSTEKRALAAPQAIALFKGPRTWRSYSVPSMVKRTANQAAPRRTRRPLVMTAWTPPARRQPLELEELLPLTKWKTEPLMAPATKKMHAAAPDPLEQRHRSIGQFQAAGDDLDR